MRLNKGLLKYAYDAISKLSDLYNSVLAPMTATPTVLSVFFGVSAPPYAKYIVATILSLSYVARQASSKAVQPIWENPFLTMGQDLTCRIQILDKTTRVSFPRTKRALLFPLSSAVMVWNTILAPSTAANSILFGLGLAEEENASETIIQIAMWLFVLRLIHEISIDSIRETMHQPGKILNACFPADRGRLSYRDTIALELPTEMNFEPETQYNDRLRTTLIQLARAAGVPFGLIAHFALQVVCPGTAVRNAMNHPIAIRSAWFFLSIFGFGSKLRPDRLLPNWSHIRIFKENHLINKNDLDEISETEDHHLSVLLLNSDN